jgi:hypothetical protein
VSGQDLKVALLEAQRQVKELNASYQEALADLVRVQNGPIYFGFFYSAARRDELRASAESTARAHCEGLKAEIEVAEAKLSAIEKEQEEKKARRNLEVTALILTARPKGERSSLTTTESKNEEVDRDLQRIRDLIELKAFFRGIRLEKRRKGVQGG